jgi:hypothetical protein
MAPEQAPVIIAITPMASSLAGCLNIIAPVPGYPVFETSIDPLFNSPNANSYLNSGQIY